MDDTPMPSFEDLYESVLQWGNARGILANGTPNAQLFKAGSELGELMDAHVKRDMAGIIDGIGDVLVTIILYCELQGLNPVLCLADAYEEIKDRKGYLNESGVFIKE